jgi:hypothetical protein
LGLLVGAAPEAHFAAAVGHTVWLRRLLDHDPTI